jgi:hypothetical protein
MAVIATVRFTGPKRISTTRTNFSMTAAVKIGAQIRITVRKIWVSLSSGYPYLALFRQVHRQLQVAALRC